MENNTYPCDPREKTKKCREDYRFDHHKLLTEDLVPYRPHNEFAHLKRIKLGIIYYDYFGQVDKETR